MSQSAESAPVTHVLHATTAVNAGEVHVTVRVHLDKRLTLALTPALAATLGHSLVRAAAKPRRAARARAEDGSRRLPVLKPSGRLV